MPKSLTTDLQGNLTASFKLFQLVAWIGLFYLPVWAAFTFQRIPLRDRLVQACHRGILSILGVRVTMRGELSPQRPLLLVTNHVSYLDVHILAACANLRFTPKDDVAKWPVFGSIARLCSCIFIDRRPERVGDMKSTLHQALANDNVICLFPEATTGNGLRMQRFKSGFFSLAQESFNGKMLNVQPASIAYTHISNLPLDTTQWPSIAWYGDMELMPHLWSLLKLGTISVELVFLPPVTLAGFKDRKALAAHCQDVIAQTIEDIRQRPAVAPQLPGKHFNPRLLRIKND
jgi:lyso-ornithine lipid O-acyltransferase